VPASQQEDQFQRHSKKKSAYNLMPGGYWGKLGARRGITARRRTAVVPASQQEEG